MISSYASGLLADGGVLFIGALGIYVILTAGQLSLGGAAFMATGAYIASVLTVRYGWSLAAATAAASLCSAALGVTVAFPALRLRGVYLAMATIGFGEMTRSFLLGFAPTGGAEGFHGMARIGAGTVWLCAAALLAAVLWLERTRFWLALRAVRDDDFAAGLVGLDTTALKLAGFGLSAGITAVAGTLFAHVRTYVEPGDFSLALSTELVIAVVLGGSNTALGPLLGAAVLTLLPETLRFMADWRLATFGALLVAIIAFRRQGLLDGADLRRVWRRA